jgi:hypothetical protein
MLVARLAGCVDAVLFVLALVAFFRQLPKRRSPKNSILPLPDKHKEAA